MKNLIIFGSPGAGKGTQAGLIAAKYQLAHLSSGEILRQAVSSGSSLGAQIQAFQVRGELVPDELIIKIFQEQLDSLNKQNFILDGYPRTLAQAHDLDEYLKNQPITAIINLQLPEEEAIKRIILRGESSGRADDNEEVVRNRFTVYRAQTMPLLDYYKQQNKVIEIDGRPAIEEIFEKITAALDNLSA